MNDPQNDELEYLRWFACNAYFGPSDGDVKARMRASYETETGKKVPDGWRDEE